MYIYIYMQYQILRFHSFSNEEYNVLRYDAVLIDNPGCSISQYTVIFIQNINSLNNKETIHILTSQETNKNK